METFVLAKLALITLFFVFSNVQQTAAAANGKKQVKYGQVILIGTRSKNMEFNQRAVPNGIQQNPKSTKILEKKSGKNSTFFTNKKSNKSVPNSPHAPAVVDTGKKPKSLPNSPHKPTWRHQMQMFNNGGRTPNKTVPNSPQRPSTSGGASRSAAGPSSPINPSFLYSPRRPSSAAAGTDDDEHSHTITFTRNDHTQVVTEYKLDRNRDMFQIGRAKNDKIDFSISQSGRISRFACRIVAERNAPENVFIYAAGFDLANSIFLGDDASRIEKPDGQFDGLVTNGVLILPPPPRHQDEFTSEELMIDDTQSVHESSNFYEDVFTNRPSTDKPPGFRARFSPKVKKLFKHPAAEMSGTNGANLWRNEENPSTSAAHSHLPKDRWKEVSVTGDIYSLREVRKAGLIGELQPHLSNKLEDGTLIDICGATLVWRSAIGIQNSPTKQALRAQLEELNSGVRPQDPVHMHTLIFKQYGEQSSSTNLSGVMKVPYVYQKCGHVQTNHGWNVTGFLRKLESRPVYANGANGKHKCPICKVCSENVIKLTVGDEPAFHMDTNALSHAFNPCGHIASQRTVEYWSDIKIPNDSGNFHSICPFCSKLLDEADPIIRLYFS